MQLELQFQLRTVHGLTLKRSHTPHIAQSVPKLLQLWSGSDKA